MFVNVGFSYDEKDNYYFGFSFSSVIQKDKNYNLKYILAILNSKVAENWFYKNGKKRGAGVDIGVEKLRLFPIKKLSTFNQRPFISLVDRILAITKDKDYLQNPAKQAKVKEYEKQIDQMVYKLYGLTNEEIDIIEGNKK
jgi:adenine-specific DNA-methyltransferase